MHSGDRNVLAISLVLVTALGCADVPNPSAGAIAIAGMGSTNAAGATAAGNAAGGGAAGSAGNAAASAAGNRGGNAAGSGGGNTAGNSPASSDDAGSGSPVASPDAGTVTDPQLDASAADSGPTNSTDATVPAEIPDPVTEPVVWGFGLGITDMPAAVKFYTEVMKMTVEKEVVREDRSETVLYASAASRGARLILMKFNDNRMTRNVTAKLVWQAANAGAVDRAASEYPDYVSRLNVGIVQFDGPETYIQEVGSIFDTEGGDIEVPYLIAMGFSVSDLAAGRTFYTTGLGMTEEPLGTFSVTDATGSGSITEYTVIHEGGPGVVLQDWTPERNSKDNPVKVVLSVPDAQAAADGLVAAGGTIVEPAKRTPVYDNRLLIVAKDLDGYLLELVQ